MSARKLKLHIERPYPPGTFFAVLPALCGRKQERWCEMYPPTKKDPPEKHARFERAHRPFYADEWKYVTCRACRKLAHHYAKSKKR